MLNPTAVPPQHVLILWIILISFLGVFLAVPAKRQMINVEQPAVPHRHRGRDHAAHAACEEPGGGGAGGKRSARAGVAGAAVGILPGRGLGRASSTRSSRQRFGTQWLRIGNYTAHELTLRF
jgi:hypothetical protein